MFLEATMKRNTAMIEAALGLHQKGAIQPNTFVLDVDQIVQNAALLGQTASRLGLQLYMMTKQIGRNPHVARKIKETGLTKAVAVDPWEALTLAAAGVELGNVGHLVQIPTKLLDRIVALQPEVITVFTLEKAWETARAAQRQGKVQDLLLRVARPGDLVYPGQTGGFLLEQLAAAAEEIKKFSGVRIAGVTVFPCFLYNGETGLVEATPNAETLIAAASLLEEDLKLNLSQINAPSANSVTTLPLIKDLGATHGEPGHAFTGTTPLNAHQVQPEVPALVYVSEVSHCYKGRAYTYGGGFYARGNIQKALVGRSWEQACTNILAANVLPAENIDYYGELLLEDKAAAVGDTVIYAFRSQIFVSRSQVAVVEGIQRGRPRLQGIYDSAGNLLING